MRMGLAVVVVGVLVLASSAGADVVLNFGTTGGSGFNLSSGGVLSFPSGPIQDTDAIVLDDVIRIGSLSINQGSRVVSGPLVTYAVTPASVAFSIWDTSDTIEYVSGTLATNNLYIYFGGPIVFAGITGNLTGITPVTATSNADIVALETAGQGSVLLTLNKNIDPALDTDTATSGDLSGSVDVSVVPEPATLALTGLGVMALFIRRKK